MRHGIAAEHRGQGGIDSMYAQEKPKRNPMQNALCQFAACCQAAAP